MTLTPKSLDYCSIVFRVLTPKKRYKTVTDRILRVFYEADMAMLNLTVWNNWKLLKQFDENHIQIYEADEEQFSIRPLWLTTDIIRYVFVNLFMVRFIEQ